MSYDQAPDNLLPAVSVWCLGLQIFLPPVKAKYQSPLLGPLTITSSTPGLFLFGVSGFPLLACLATHEASWGYSESRCP